MSKKKCEKKKTIFTTRSFAQKNVIKNWNLKNEKGHRKKKTCFCLERKQQKQNEF